jgi:hypothetical protein
MRCILLALAILALSQQAYLAAAASPPAGQPQAPAPAPADNPELCRLYNDDQSDRNTPDGRVPDWRVVGPRDHARQARVRELYRSEQLRTGADYYHAAMVLQHGQAPDDFLLCHELCVAAIILGSKEAGWLAAASEDRFLMNLGRPQRFGTQYRSIGDAPMALYPTDEGVTDSLRKAVGVPALAEARAREARMNRKGEPQNQPAVPPPAPATPEAGQPARQP